MRLVQLLIIFLMILPFITPMGSINLSDMTLEQKVGQLMFVQPDGLNEDYITHLQVGGIFLDNLKSYEEYSNVIQFYKNLSEIPLFVATDMEGYWNPFSDFYSSAPFGEISSSKNAYELGEEQGKILKELGFNLDFSPIVEVRNNVWPGRSFTGTDEEIKEKISNYIQGLHSQNILATAKHYPGGSLVKNPHWIKFKVNATEQELAMFQEAIDSNVDFIMIGHPVIYGALDSNGKQATLSPEIIEGLKENYGGLIITDAVTMWGLRISYLFNFKKIYPDLIRAGNDLLLDTHTNSDYNQLIKRRDELIKQAEIDGELITRIDESVKKVLKKKGYEVLI